MYDQYGKEQANAILGTVMTKIFLPGLDDVTAEYASKQLGDTTIYAKTFQDFPGKKNDNVRYAEQKRALMHAGEIRQIAAHKELIIVNDTAPPIKAAYPPLALLKQKFEPATYGMPRAFYLGDIDADFRFADSEAVSDTDSVAENQADFVESETNEKFENAIFEAVDAVVTEDTIFFDDENNNMKFDTPLNDKEDVASRINPASIKTAASYDNDHPATVIISKTIENEAETASAENEDGGISDALCGLSDDVRRVHQEINSRAKSEINRSVF